MYVCSLSVAVLVSTSSTCLGVNDFDRRPARASRYLRQFDDVPLDQVSRHRTLDCPIETAPDSLKRRRAQGPALFSTLHRSCFRPGWRSPIAVPISTSGNSALAIGAGYMIVSELGLNPGGLWTEAAFLPT